MANPFPPPLHTHLGRAAHQADVPSPLPGTPTTKISSDTPTVFFIPLLTLSASQRIFSRRNWPTRFPHLYIPTSDMRLIKPTSAARSPAHRPPKFQLTHQPFFSFNSSRTPLHNAIFPGKIGQPVPPTILSISPSSSPVITRTSDPRPLAPHSRPSPSTRTIRTLPDSPSHAHHYKPSYACIPIPKRNLRGHRTQARKISKIHSDLKILTKFQSPPDLTNPSESTNPHTRDLTWGNRPC